MGFPPPIDAPPPEIQDAQEAAAGFAPLPTGSLCGFALPGFSFNFIPKLPGIALGGLSFPPLLNFAIGLRCDLDEPIAGDAGFGGGRHGTTGLEDDPEFGRV